MASPQQRLPRYIQELLKKNRVELIKTIDLDKGLLWDHLIQQGIVEPHEKNLKETGALLNHIGKSTIQEFRRFCDILRECKQGHVVTDLLTDKGLAITGKPVQLVKFDDKDNCLKLIDERALDRILLDKRVHDKPVALFSVAGGHQTGKSMFLNQTLKYLTALESGETIGWIDRTYQIPDSGRWATGPTEGIALWDRPYIVPGPGGKEVAVVLMDTQGEMDESTAIITLSSLLSSVQVYNVPRKLAQENIRHLQLYVDAGKEALDNGIGDSQEKPFQRLLFLIRDWSQSETFGAAAGQKYMKDTMEAKKGRSKVWRNVHEHGTNCIEQLECFLMPHPDFGEGPGKVHLQGAPSAVQKSFVTSLVEAVEFLLSPRKLVVKRCGNKTMTGSTLAAMFKECTALFASQAEPEANDIYQVLLNNYNEQLVEEIIEDFSRKMGELSSNSSAKSNKPVFEKTVRDAERYARNTFGDRCKGKQEDTDRLYQNMSTGMKKAKQEFNIKL